MKRFVIPIVVSVIIVAGGLGVAGSAPREEAPSSLFQPANTPPAPGDGGFVYQALPASEEIPGQDSLGEVVAEKFTEGSYSRSEQALLQTGMRFSSLSHGGDLSPQEFRVFCQDMLLNPQMDVEVFPTDPPTGSADPWELFWPRGYFSDSTYHSASYALAMADDNDSYSPFTFDYDALGQAFYAPSGLMTVTITFSGYHTNANDGDDAWVNLFTLDGGGSLDTLVTYGLINYTSGVWVNWTWTITNSTTLAALSGMPVALVFDMENDRVAPNEWFYLDDVQLNLCYGFDVVSEVYLPLVNKNPVPSCVPKEPDSRDDPGSTVVGVACNGSFSPLDTRDYYSLDPGGVSNVRLWLRNMPAGTNWGAAIFEDNPSNTYVCHIGTTGSSDKYVDCTLNPSKQYFVKVDAGTPPGSTQTYQMSVVPR